MQAQLDRVRMCVMCNETGKLANNEGIRCCGCDMFFHQHCIDPRRTTPIDSVQTGKAVMWACPECADTLEEVIDAASGDENESGESGDGESDNEDAESDDDESGDGEAESNECEYCECNCAELVCKCVCECTASDLEADAAADADFIEEAAETVEKLRKGETVWNRSKCECDVCAEMNAATDEWPRIVAAVKNGERNVPPIVGMIVRATKKTEKNVLDPHLAELLFLAGKKTATSDQVSRRGHL